MKIMTQEQAKVAAQNIRNSLQQLCDELQEAKERGLIIDFQIAPNEADVLIFKSFSATLKIPVL